MAVLSTAADARNKRNDAARNLDYVTRHSGMGPYRQFLQILGMMLGPGRFTPVDYYKFGLWRDEVTPARRRAYVSFNDNRPFNDGFRVPALGEMDEVIEDKLATSALLAKAGHAVPMTMAQFAGPPVEGVETLKDAKAIRGFLARPGVLPCFGKPRFGSLGQGAAWFAGQAVAGETLVLGNGIGVPLGAVVDEIARDWQGGYLLQKVLRNARALRPYAGQATGMLRLTTVLTGNGAEVLYAIQKLPSATAMHDKASLNPSAAAMIDPATGAVLALRRYNDPVAADEIGWNGADDPIAGMILPGYDTAVDMVLRAHGLFPAHGILGWDICLTDDGPVMVEVNANPIHVTQQDVAREGLKTGARAAIIARALERRKHVERTA